MTAATWNGFSRSIEAVMNATPYICTDLLDNVRQATVAAVQRYGLLTVELAAPTSVNGWIFSSDLSPAAVLRSSIISIKGKWARCMSAWSCVVPAGSTTNLSTRWRRVRESGRED